MIRLRSALLLLALACTDDGAGPSSPPGRSLVVLAGGDQSAPTGSPLPHPVVVRLLDNLDQPVPGALVEFRSIAGGGKVINSSSVTDRQGRAAVVWQLGPSPRPHQLEVTSDGAAAISVSASVGASSCLAAECQGIALDESVPFHPVTYPTYEGSGQGVHPDLAVSHHPGALPLTMVFTPYPWGNAMEENPSVVESANGRHWRDPIGVSNPVARSLSGHLSDPDIVLDPTTGHSYLYYREVAAGRNRIHLLISSDGRAWDHHGVVLDVPSHRALSPAVVRGSQHGPWWMWSVNSGAQGCSAQATSVELRSSADGVAWGEPVETDLGIPGQVVWHLDVQWMPALAEYWALFNTYPVGGTCVTRALFLARSSDGIHWSVPESPLLVAGRVPAFRDVVYRGTFRLSEDGRWVELLLSGAVYGTGGYRWSIGRVVLRPGEALDTELGVGDGVDWGVPAPSHLPPPEPFDQP